MDMVCPQGSRISLREFGGKVKGRVCPEYLVFRLHTGWLVSRLCGITERDQRELLLWFPVFPSIDPAIIPFLCATKAWREGTVGLCVCLLQPRRICHRWSNSLQEQIHISTSFVQLFEDGRRCSAVLCWAESTDSIHINGALLAQ